MDWTNILDQLIQILLPVFATLITAITGYVATKIKQLYEEKVTTETIKTVVDDTVKFVEQVYTDIHGQEKLQKAVERVTQILNEKGIMITETEINTLIEAAVYGLNHNVNTIENK